MNMCVKMSKAVGVAKTTCLVFHSCYLVSYAVVDNTKNRRGASLLQLLDYSHLSREAVLALSKLCLRTL